MTSTVDERDLPSIRDLPPDVIHSYRKRPIEVQAVLWDGTMYIADFLHQWSRGDVWLDGGRLMVRTPEGEVYATLGSYIVCGVMGEFYPIQAHIFDRSFDAC